MHWLFILFISLFSTDFIEDFSSLEESQNSWEGDWSHFTVNWNHQLQNRVEGANESVLIRPSTASIDAEWSYWTRIYGGASAYNLTRWYILESDSLTGNGYFIQVGGANKNITLYKLTTGTEKKIIESSTRKKILGDDAIVHIRLIRGANGIFHLYSLVEGVDFDFAEEGSYFASWLPAQYVGILFKNSSQHGDDLYMDDIIVHGEEQTEPLTPLSGDTSGLQLHISGDCLSLNQDGYEDAIEITYNGPDNVYKANLNVYSADGRHICTCCQSEPLHEEGILTWNGHDQHDRPVDIGVYVMIIEVTSKTHAPIRKRYSIAVLH